MWQEELWYSITGFQYSMPTPEYTGLFLCRSSSVVLVVSLNTLQSLQCDQPQRQTLRSYTVACLLLLHQMWE